MRTVYIRRSVAAGEARFPFSDLDLAMIIEPADGDQLDALRRRYRAARVAFPRLGECQVLTQTDLEEQATTDPYRSSLDRRIGLTVFGPPPAIPETPLRTDEVARRLVFWFDDFIPTARRTHNRRNLGKFALEIANALGVLEGRWPAPLTSRRETAACVALPEGDLFSACLTLAARAHALLRPPAPRLSAPLDLGTLVIAPLAVASGMPRNRAVVTPEVLDLLVQYQKPWLWHAHGERLASLGFEPPSAAAWRAAARRFAGGERVRGPGFLERGTRPAVARLQAAATVLGVEAPALPPASTTLSAYYREYHDTLAQWAAALRAKASVI